MREHEKINEATGFSLIDCLFALLLLGLLLSWQSEFFSVMSRSLSENKQNILAHRAYSAALDAAETTLHDLAPEEERSFRLEPPYAHIPVFAQCRGNRATPSGTVGNLRAADCLFHLEPSSGAAFPAKVQSWGPVRIWLE